MGNLVKILLSTVFFTITILLYPANVPAAHANVTQKDFQTIVRTIGFLQNAPSSESIFAIIYNPDNSESVRDAHQMQEIVKKDSSGILNARLVSVSDTSKLQGARFVFITDGLQSYYK